MKIAIFDHILNQGGSSRYLRCLLPALKAARPDWKFVFFCNVQSLQRDGLQDEFEKAGIVCRSLVSSRLESSKLFSIIPRSGMVLSILRERWKRLFSRLPLFFSGAVEKEIERYSTSFDLLFCPWPYLVKCPSVKCPLVATFHDFNFRYYFTGPTFYPAHYESMMKEIPHWLRASFPVVSTEFIKTELEKFYPEEVGKVKVIPLSSLSACSLLGVEEARGIIEKMEISTPYILYPTNISPHKNIGALLGAFDLLKKQFPSLILVFAGYGTEVVNGKVTSCGVERGRENRDVIGLGYISNLQMDALVRCAEVVVSTSLYEAGCGPALDAWLSGVPVAMSNIPPYLEHFSFLGVKAKVFDPRSCQDIAEKIGEILTHRESAQQDALDSKIQMQAYGWNKVAEQYISLFESCLRSNE